jgi:hypothetical protein
MLKVRQFSSRVESHQVSRKAVEKRPEVDIFRDSNHVRPSVCCFRFLLFWRISCSKTWFHFSLSRRICNPCISWSAKIWHRVRSKNNLIIGVNLCRECDQLIVHLGHTLILVRKNLTKKLYFGHNLGSCFVQIFRPEVRKWSFRGNELRPLT